MLHSGDIPRKFFGVFLCLFFLRAYAAEQSVDSDLGITARYNDNLRLFENNQDSAKGVIIEPKIKLNIDDDIWAADLAGSVRSARYVSAANLNNDSVFIKANGRYRTELDQFQLGFRDDDVASLNRNIKTILEDPGKDNEQWNRKTQTLSASWFRQLTEDTNTSLNLSRTQVAYSGNIPANYSGYETKNMALSYNWEINERSKIQLSASLLKFMNDVQTFSYDQTIYQLAYDYSITQTARLSMSLGTRILDSVFYNGRLIACDLYDSVNNTCLLNPLYEDIKTKNDGSVANISFSDRGERSQYSIDGSRTIIPSSVGGAQQQDKFSANYRYSIGPKINIRLNVNMTKLETVKGGASNSRDLERKIFSTSLVYKLTRDMNLRLNYQYLQSLYFIDGIDRISNAISISLRTTWPRLISTY